MEKSSQKILSSIRIFAFLMERCKNRLVPRQTNMIITLNKGLIDYCFSLSLENFFRKYWGFTVKANTQLFGSL